MEQDNILSRRYDLSAIKELQEPTQRLYELYHDGGLQKLPFEGALGFDTSFGARFETIQIGDLFEGLSMSFDARSATATRPYEAFTDQDGCEMQSIVIKLDAQNAGNSAFYLLGLIDSRQTVIYPDNIAVGFLYIDEMSHGVTPPGVFGIQEGLGLICNRLAFEEEQAVVAEFEKAIHFFESNSKEVAVRPSLSSAEQAERLAWDVEAIFGPTHLLTQRFATVGEVYKANDMTLAAALRSNPETVYSVNRQLKESGLARDPETTQLLTKEQYDMLGKTISALGLSVYAYNRLGKGHIFTLRELCGKTKYHIDALPNVGDKTLDEIIDKLAEHDLALVGEDALVAMGGVPLAEQALAYLDLSIPAYHAVKSLGLTTIGEITARPDLIHDMPDLAKQELAQALVGHGIIELPEELARYATAND